MRVRVEISETSIHTYELDNVASREEAEQTALQMFEEGEEANEVDVLDIEVDSYETEAS